MEQVLAEWPQNELPRLGRLGSRKKNSCEHCSLSSLKIVSSAYLVVLPVPKEVNGAISPPLQHGPSSIVKAMFTPGLDQSITAVCFKQVHPAGGVACLSYLETVFEGTCGRKDGCRKNTSVLVVDNAERNKRQQNVEMNYTCQ